MAIEKNEEEERYDRQIRLWGAEAQNNLRKSNILMIGVGGTGSEIVKNVVLSGINSMTLVDSVKIGECEQSVLDAQMIIYNDIKNNSPEKTLSEASISRCEELNPNVKTTALTNIPYTDIQAGKFTVVCACDQTRETQLKISKACRASSPTTPFISGYVNGFFGTSIADLGDSFNCRVTRTEEKSMDLKKSKNEENTEKDQKMEDQEDDEEKVDDIVVSYPDFKSVIEKIQTPCFDKIKNRAFKNLNQALIVNELYQRGDEINETNCQQLAEFMTNRKDFYTGKWSEFHTLENISLESRGQISPVCAVVGGFIAQEIIRVASRKELPFKNVFLFDGIHYKGDILEIC